MKTALVTGGSSGLGFEMARQLAAREYHVMIVARNDKQIERAVGAIREAGCRATGFQGDIRDYRDLRRIAKSLKDQGHTIDFLILNAGVVQVRLLRDYTRIDDMKRDMETNLWGTILSAYTFTPFLTAGSKILIISSGLGLVGVSGYSIYCAAKAGLINFAEALRRELYQKQVAVYVACPGDVDTPQYRQEFSHMPEWMKKKTSSGRRLYRLT